MKRLIAILLALAALLPAFAGDLSIPTIIGSGMVLQRNSDACIWGWADEGVTVKVSVSWSKTVYTAKADVFGEWKVYIPTPDAMTGQTVKITGDGQKINLKDISLGDVWICSGQSNMQFSVGNSIDVSELARTPNANIRLYNSGRISSDIPQQDIPESHWTDTNPKDLKAFSAVGYAFGDILQKELGVPVGLVCVSFGGTPIEAWTPEDCFTNPKWIEGHKGMLALPKSQKHPERLRVATEYNANIAPIVNMKASGVIWYQGCHNTSYSAAWYGEMLENMICAWRQKFNSPQLPFYVVQIVPHIYYDGINGALVREGQALAASHLDHVEYISTIDLGDRIGDIHPRYKVGVASRLAAAALGEHYGKDVAYRMPCYESMEVADSSVRVHFANVSGGLHCSEGGIIGFQVAGEDGRFQIAKAFIKGSDIVLSSKGVANPKYVRYCFNEYPGKVKDSLGRPLAPFRTDNLNVVGPNDPIGKSSEISISVKGIDYNGVAPVELLKGAKLWTNKELYVKDLVRELKGFQFLPATVQTGDSTMGRVSITAHGDGTIYVMLRLPKYMWKLEKEGWKLYPVAKVTYVDAKKRPRGQVFIAYRKVSDGETVVLPGGDPKMAWGVIPIAKNIIQE